MIYISLRIDCLFEIRNIAACFLWLYLWRHYRATDEAFLAVTTQYELIFYFYLHIQLHDNCKWTAKNGENVIP